MLSTLSVYLQILFSSSLPYVGQIHPGGTSIDITYPSIIPQVEESTSRRNIYLSTIAQVTDTNRLLTADIEVVFKSKKMLICLNPVGKFGDDMYYPVRKFKDVFRSDFLRAYSVYRFNKQNAMILGRTPVEFGESPRYNLILDRWGVPLELIGLSFHNQRINFNFFVSDLGQMIAKSSAFRGDTTKPVLGSRYLSFHALDFNLFNSFRFGFAEAVILGGKNQTLNWYFVNPFLIYYANQFNLRQKNSNVMWLFHFRYTSPLNIGAYGEFLIDDYQYAPDKQGEPNHTGLILGMESVSRALGKPIYWLTEYTRVTRWVYNHSTPFTKWMRYGIPLGHPYGPDFEMYYGFLSVAFGNLNIALEFENLKKGEASINDYWPVPLNNSGEYRFPKDNFLSGNVKVSNSVGLRGEFKNNNITLAAALGVIFRMKPRGSENGFYFGLGLKYGL